MDKRGTSACTRLISVISAVALITAWTAPSSGEEELSTRSFHVPINFFDLVAKPPEHIFDPFDPDIQRNLPGGFMEHLGVVFEPGCSAVLNTEKGILEVTNTASQLKLMEKIVSKLPKLTFAEEKLLVSSIVRGPDLPTVLEENPTVEKIQEMLRETRIPDLKINKTTFFDALTIVQQKGVEFHPSRKGISLIIEGNPSPFIKKPVDYTPPSTSTTVSLHRRDVSLAEAFDDLAKQANFKYHVKPHAVIFTPAALPLEKLLTTMYLMPLKLHEKLMAYEEHGGTNPFGSPDGEEPVRTTQSAFESAGISFTDGAKVSYDKKTEELFITNTVDQMDLVEPFLSSLDGGKIILSHDSRYHRKSPDSE